MRRIVSRQNSGLNVTFRKPGPATSTEAKEVSSFRRASAIFAASSRGGIPAALADTNAKLEARSPCLGSLEGSMTALSGQGRFIFFSTALKEASRCCSARM